MSIGSPREFFERRKEDQKLAEACKRLIKNCIVCWNYLYLSQQFAAIDDPAKRKEFIQALRHGSAASWAPCEPWWESMISPTGGSRIPSYQASKIDRLTHLEFWEFMNPGFLPLLSGLCKLAFL